MDLGATRVEVFVDGRVTVGGEPIAPPDGMDPYSAAIAVLAEYARSSGSPALAHAVDHTNGQEGRFRVLADGTAEPVAEAVLPAAREDFPRTEQQAPRPDMDTAPGAAGEPSPYGAPPH